MSIEQPSNTDIDDLTDGDSKGDDDGDEGDDSVVVSDLANVESIVVDYAIIDIKGLLTMHFSEFILNEEAEADASPERRLLQNESTLRKSEELKLAFIVDETKNGLDEESTRFSHSINSFSD